MEKKHTILYTLNLHSDVCQSYLNKTGVGWKLYSRFKDIQCGLYSNLMKRENIVDTFFILK